MSSAKKKNSNKIQIIGDNILYYDGLLIAHYILPLANYSIISDDGIQDNIDNITHILSNLVDNKQNQSIKFSLQRCNKTIKAKDIKNNLLDTIKIYRPEYNMPEAFTNNLDDSSSEYCLLLITLDKTVTADIEAASLKEQAKDFIKSFAIKSNNDISNLDITKILEIEDSTYQYLKHYCLRASSELVFYHLASKIYPAYEISYDKISYFQDSTYSNILSSLNQVLEDKFGYFIMHNEGVDIFGLKPEDVYGCIINLEEFPLQINTTRTPINFQNTSINIHMLRGSTLKRKVKMKRGSIKAELDEALEANAEEEEINPLVTEHTVATNFMKKVQTQENGFCEFNTSILVLGNTLQELKDRTTEILSILKQQDILAGKSLHQSADFINNYIKINPEAYTHTAELMFPLSFQLNYGSIVGDFDSGISTPPIGYSI